MYTKTRFSRERWYGEKDNSENQKQKVTQKADQKQKVV